MLRGRGDVRRFMREAGVEVSVSYECSAEISLAKLSVSALRVGMANPRDTSTTRLALIWQTRARACKHNEHRRLRDVARKSFGSERSPNS